MHSKTHRRKEQNRQRHQQPGSVAEIDAVDCVLLIARLKHLFHKIANEIHLVLVAVLLVDLLRLGIVECLLKNEVVFVGFR